MINKIKALRSNEEGFTLIELMVVVLIIGILAAIAIPIFLSVQAEAVKSGVKSDVKNTVAAVAEHLASDATAANLNSSKTGTAAATGPITPVVSDEATTVEVVGGWTGYTVSGYNVNVDGFGFAHYSSDTAPATSVAPAATVGKGGKYVVLNSTATAPEAPGTPTEPATPTGPVAFQPPVTDEDLDGDGLSNGDEEYFGTNPNNPDTDGDGVSDMMEANSPGGDPLNASVFPVKGDVDGDGNPDNDGDGYYDFDESWYYGTDYNDANSRP